MISPQDFITLLNGVWVSVKADGLSVPGKIDTECFDIANLWARAVGAPRFTSQYANQIYDEAGTMWEKIANTPDNFPQVGDLVIFTYPHVGLATGKNTDALQVELLEQNDPINRETQIKSYSYKNAGGNYIIRGWLRKVS